MMSFFTINRHSLLSNRLQSGIKFIVFVFAASVLSSCGIRRNHNKQVRHGVVLSTPTKPTAITVTDVMGSVRNQKLIDFINEWKGVKYKFGGNDKNGIDCSGFSCVLEKQIFDVNLNRISKDQALQIDIKPLEQLNEGDLIFFSFLGNGVIDHVGVYLNQGFFVHASTTRGVVVDDLKQMSYLKYIVKSGSVNIKQTQ